MNRLTRPSNTWFAGAITILALTLFTGCLGEPEIDEKWTLVEFVNITPQPGVTTPGDQPIDVTVRGRITYRRILTGFLVAEVRYSDTLSPTSVASLNPDESNLDSAQDVDLILANSVTAGRATRAVTGFDHLQQEIDLAFTAQVPSAMFGSGTQTGWLYLLLYAGSGNEIQLASGADSLVVTPFVSTSDEVLHTGFALTVTPPGGGP